MYRIVAPVKLKPKLFFLFLSCDSSWGNQIKTVNAIGIKFGIVKLRFVGIKICKFKCLPCDEIRKQLKR